MNGKDVIIEMQSKVFSLARKIWGDESESKLAAFWIEHGPINEKLDIGNRFDLDWLISELEMRVK